MRKHYRLDLTPATVPAEDRVVYDMLSKADFIGVFQVESRAQQTMLPRLKPQCFYDLVIEVAIVRPGPIQGDMVHPYLRRRQGLEDPDFPSEELKDILAKTLGVPLFQEQCMKIAIVAAGFSPSRADELRRAMATFKKWAPSANSRTSSSTACSRKVMNESSPSAASARSRGSAPMAFPKVTRLLRAARLLLGLDEVLLPRRVRRRDPEQPAHGILCAGTAGARRPRA